MMLMFVTISAAVICAETEVKRVAIVATKTFVKSILKIGWIALSWTQRMVILNRD